MNTHDCKAIRREIDEANLDARLTLEASEHLSSCDECRRFHDDRRTLRGLMADLETVGAPADFDFRLRARLAREKPSNGFGSLLLTARPIAAVALVLLIALMAVIVRNRMSPVQYQPLAGGTASQKGNTIPAAGNRATPFETVSSAKDSFVKESSRDTLSLFKPGPVTRRRVDRAGNTTVQRATNSAAGNGPRFTTRDSAASAAAVITPDSLGAFVVVPVDGRAFKVSIDDGRGGARTISLPPVSFGSQRLLAQEAAFVPLSSAKGAW